MRYETKNKPKSDAVTASDLDALYEKIVSSQNKNYSQGTKDNDFKPETMTIPNAPTAPIQTQYAGTQFYDNTPTTFVAPSYGQLKDVSIKRSNQAIATHSAWDKSKANLVNSMPDIQDEDFKTVQSEFLGEMDKYEAKLKEGDWADQTTMVSSFVDDLINKKGGKQMASLKTTMEERRKELEKLLQDHDYKTGTGGIDPASLNYLLKGTYNKSIRDNEGNVIGGLSVSYPDIHPSRNMFVELNDLLSKAKASSREGEMVKDENGNMVKQFFVSPDMIPILGKYGITTTEAVTEAQLTKAALAYIDTSNGDSYLGFQGRVKEFNSPLSADDIRARLEPLANAEGANPTYQKLLNLPDDALLAQSKQLRLGELLQANDLKNSLIEGTVKLNAYSKEDTTFVEDAAAIHAAIAQIDDQYKDHTGNGSGVYDEDGNEVEADLPYTFSVTDTSIYNAKAMFASENIANRATQINNETASINARLNAYKNNPNVNFESDSHVKSLLQQKEKLDRERKVISEIQKKSFKELSDVSMKYTKIGLSSVVNFLQGQVVNGKRNGISTGDLANVLQTAIYAEIDSDPNTNAESILKRYNVSNTYDVYNNLTYSKMDAKSTKYLEPFITQPQRANVDYRAEDVNFTDEGNPQFVLSNYIKKVADSYKDLRKETDKDGNPVYNPEITANMLTFDMTGDTTKFPEAKKYVSALGDIKSGIESNPAHYKIANPLGGAEKSLDRELLDITDVEPRYLNDVVKLESVKLASLQDSTNQGLTYVAQYTLKDVSEKDNPKAYKAMQAVKKKLGTSNYIQVPVRLGQNSHKDENVKTALLGLVNTNDSTLNGLDSVSRQQVFLTLSKMSGVSDAIDTAYLYNLDGSGRAGAKSTRNMRINGIDIQVKAIDNPYATTKEDKHFEVRVKTPDGYKYPAIDSKGTPVYITEAQAKDKQYTVKSFETSEDLKSYFTEVKYRQEKKVGNFNKGGSNAKYGTDRPTDKSRTYQSNLILNGKPFKTNTFVPEDQLVDVRGKIKMSGSAGIPFIHKSIEQDAINLANKYGLTMTGGLRTQEHQVSKSATNSAHFGGNALDFKLDNNARKLYNDIQTNPNLAKRLGIQFAHDGDHIHITFSGKANNINSGYKKSSIMSAIGAGESGNKDLGYHYKNTDNLSAYGKYGFTNTWINRMASYYNTTPDKIRASPSLVDEYANTEYLKIAERDIKPIFSQLKQKMERYIPNFSKEDAIFIYHYGGIGRVKQIARGEFSPLSVPPSGSDKYPNRLSIKEYIEDRRKYLR